MADELISAEAKKIPGWVMKITFLLKGQNCNMLGINLGLVSWAFSPVTPFGAWAFLCFNKAVESLAGPGIRTWTLSNGGRNGNEVLVCLF